VDEERQTTRVFDVETMAEPLERDRASSLSAARLLEYTTRLPPLKFTLEFRPGREPPFLPQLLLSVELPAVLLAFLQFARLELFLGELRRVALGLETRDPRRAFVKVSNQVSGRGIRFEV
jgi:hypothetical protein